MRAFAASERKVVGGWFFLNGGKPEIWYVANYRIGDHYHIAMSIGPNVFGWPSNGVERRMKSVGGVRFVLSHGVGNGRDVQVDDLGVESEEAISRFAKSFPRQTGWTVFDERRQLSAADLERIGFPPFKAMRPNPPKDIDSDEVLGGECAVWALAAASGRSVPDVRRAFMDAGIDIWTNDGLATGTSPDRIRRVMQKLDVEKKIAYIGYSYPMLTQKSKMAYFHTSRSYTSKFMHGKDPDQFAKDQAYEEGFKLPDGVTSGANRATVGQVLRLAKRDGVAALVITGRLRLYTRKFEKGPQGTTRHLGIKGTTHIVGYSPASGVFDTAAQVPYDRAVERAKETGQWLKGGDWHRHGQEIPDGSRPALLWVYFKGE